MSLPVFPDTERLAAARLRISRLSRCAPLHEAGRAASGQCSTRTANDPVIDSAVVNLLNPKAIVFPFAFLPQFATASDTTALEAESLAPGLVFIGIAARIDVACTDAASGVRGIVASQPGRMQAVQRFSGVVLMSLGVFGAAQVLV